MSFQKILTTRFIIFVVCVVFHSRQSTFGAEVGDPAAAASQDATTASQTRPQATPHGDASQSLTLQKGNWYHRNRWLINGWLSDIASRKSSKQRVAVFDFDNTCIFNDVGEATLRYQLRELKIKLDPEELKELFEVKGVKKLKNGHSMDAIRTDILSSYRVLWDHIEKGDLAAAKRLGAYYDFRAKVYWFFEEADATPELGPMYTLPWLARLLGGFNSDEVAKLVSEALDADKQPRIAIWTSRTPGRIGKIVRHSFKTGVIAHPEMIDLMRLLKSAGVQPYVVSASSQPVVQAAAKHFRFPLEAHHIFGIRVKVDEHERLTTNIDTNYPITYRQGKVHVIRDLIRSEPVLVAGDADTDFEMLTAFPKTEIRLLINRNRHLDAASLIARLYNDPDVILQGRDENTGSFQPARQTVSLKADPRAE